MYNQLINFIDVNRILYKYQFGFRKYHSTMIMIIIIVHIVYVCVCICMYKYVYVMYVYMYSYTGCIIFYMY